MIHTIHADDHSRVYINEFMVATFCCGHMAHALEVRLRRIQDMSQKDGIQDFMVSLGCCEAIADLLYSMLVEPQGTLQ